MNQTPGRPSAEQLAELSAYLEARNRGEQPAPGEPDYPSGLAGELLRLAEGTTPDPAFAARLELQLRQAAKAGSKVSPPNWWHALWQSFTLPERKTTMKRLLTFALLGIALFAIAWATIPSLFPSPQQTQVALVTPPTSTPAPTPVSQLTPTVVPPTPKQPLAINFTPQPLPSQPPSLPSLVDALSGAYGGSGAGNLPQAIPLSLATSLPSSPETVPAYYRLENTPLTPDQASQLASQWGLDGNLYMPGWMQSVTPDDLERSYIAVDGMQSLSMWNGELSYQDLSIAPIYAGHQYPQSGLPAEDQAVGLASEFLTERGLLGYPFQADLSSYAYGLVTFERLLDGIPLDEHATSVTLNLQGQVGSAWVSREDYQPVGSYPLVSAQTAWDLLSSGQPSDQIAASYYPAQDGNPQYWGRVYHIDQEAHLFGAPTYLLPVEPGVAPYVQLNNLVLAGDLTGLLEYLRSGQGYIHAWGQVQEISGTRQLQLAGWEPFDEFSGYFNGTIRRTAQGDTLELEDGSQLTLPDLPSAVPSNIPMYAQGGLVGNTLEWFILQVHPSDEGQNPPDLSQAQAVIEQVRLVYLAPTLGSLSLEAASNPAYRMLVPAWEFSGHLTTTGGIDMLYRAYVQAAGNP
jgi:hypothetical protein